MATALGQVVEEVDRRAGHVTANAAPDVKASERPDVWRERAVEGADVREESDSEWKELAVGLWTGVQDRDERQSDDEDVGDEKSVAARRARCVVRCCIRQAARAAFDVKPGMLETRSARCAARVWTVKR